MWISALCGVSLNKLYNWLYEHERMIYNYSAPTIYSSSPSITRLHCIYVYMYTLYVLRDHSSINTRTHVIDGVRVKYRYINLINLDYYSRNARRFGMKRKRDRVTLSHPETSISPLCFGSLRNRFCNGTKWSDRVGRTSRRGWDIARYIFKDHSRVRDFPRSVLDTCVRQAADWHVDNPSAIRAGPFIIPVDWRASWFSAPSAKICQGPLLPENEMQNAYFAEHI